MADPRVFKSAQQVTMPWQQVSTVTRTIVLDSRQRNCEKYKTPSYYRLELGDTFKNISSIELKGAAIPKSSYNVHSGNNKIDYVIGDFVSGFNIINGGAGYTVPPQVTISAPPGPGTTATATAIINAAGSITNIIINIAGSGYIPSKPPFIFIDPPNNPKQAVQPNIKVIIGNYYTATLRFGDYDIGGNPIPPNVLPTCLLLEIQNAMNYAYLGGAYDPGSIGPFALRVVNQYPTLDAVPGTPEAFNTNSCLFNRIQVVNQLNNTWQFLWCSGPNHINTAASIMGFNTVDSDVGISVAPIVTMAGVLIPGGTAIRGPFDYNLKNDPDYVIMNISVNDKKLDRMTSLDDGLSDRFAVLLFDNNNPETLHDLSAASPGSIINLGGVQYLQGPTGKGTFWRDTSGLKPIKGMDYDAKKISFNPCLGKVSSINIAFTKFGFIPGVSPQLYNMEGREHLLIFELTASDNRSQQKE